jgi:uncharacterized phage protein gp47/JayE
MTNQINNSGLILENLNDIIANLTTGLQEIYGIDINVDSNTPDGQLINIIAQAKIDILQLIQSIYNQFDPDSAIGIQQDYLYAINNIQRIGASYTYQNIQITTDRALTLQGLDANANVLDATGYTVADNLGNQFILLDTQNIADAGTYTFNFRSKGLGAINTTPNTITTPITIVLGVLSINNSTSASAIGIDGESDSAFRIRRAQSVALGSVGYLNGLLGALQNITGVVNASLFENNTSTTDANGIPANSIWAIVEGGANSDIAQEICQRKSAGCGMYGATTYNITLPSGQIFTAKFDRPTSKILYIKFDIKPLKTGQSFDTATIKTNFINLLTFKIGDAVDAYDLSLFAKQAIESVAGVDSGVPLNLQISKNNTNWFYYLTTDLLNEKWVASTTNTTITIL